MHRSGRLCTLLCSALSFLPLACAGSGSPSNANKTPGGQSSSTNGTKSSDAGVRWERLVEGSWSLEPASEDPRWCQKLVLTEDIYISAMRPVHPPGTHHTTLALIPDDGKAACSGSMFGSGLIYAAGVGSGELVMPKGVAMKLPAGQALILGLHIYNPSQQKMTGLSGIEIVRAKADEVKDEADMLIAGPISISLPAGQQTTITGHCKLTTDQTVFTLFPHMHQLGTHIKTTAILSGKPMVLHDGDYQFQEQYQLPIGPIAFHAGDEVTTECTYKNDRATTVSFGESSDTEMCFSILFRYPRGGSGICTGANAQSDGGMQSSIGGPPCAAVDAPGNEKSIGKYCTAGGGQCASSSHICLADYVQGSFGDFCTSPCQSDSECGGGAVCTGMSTKICVPQACATSPDAGH